MKTKVFTVLIAFVLSVFLASCSDTSGQQFDADQYREKLKEQKNSITPEQREKNMKSMFPNYKSKE